jgi:hypothetical protein
MRFHANFDHGISNLEAGYWASTNYTVQSGAGTRHVDLAGNGSTFSAVCSGCTSQVFGVGDRWYYLATRPTSNNPNNHTIVTAYKLGVAACSVTYQTSTGQFQVRRGDLNGTVLSSSALQAMTTGVWHYLWCDLLAKNSGGTLSVYGDGNPTAVVTFTGDTTNATTDDWDQIGWNTFNEEYMDDLCTFTDTEKLAFAPAGVYPELFASNAPPTSDVTNTFSGGGGFAQVNEAVWSTAQYAEALAAGQELLCAVTGLAWTPTAVRAVVLQTYAARDGVINQFGGILGSGAITITVKQSCNLATAAALPAYTAAGAGPGKTLTGNAVGILTVDVVPVTLGMRLLVQSEGGGTSVDNGIYKCTTEGTAGVAYVLTRATDFDNVGPDAEVDTGDVTYILAGTANGNKTFRLTTADPITVDVTPLTFAEMAAYLPSKTGAGAASYVEAQWCFALNPNGDVQWTYATAQGAKPGIQTQTAI